MVLDGDRERLRRAAGTMKQVRVERLPNQPVEADWAAVGGSQVLSIDGDHECGAKREELRCQQLDEISRRVDIGRGGDRRIGIDASGNVDSPTEERGTGHLVVLHHG
jgi:hypothetical protein